MMFLVTGGGGFLGRRLVEKLLAQGERVRVLGRNSYPDLAAQGVECVLGDVVDTEVVQKACAGCDGVYHVAGRVGFWGDRRNFFTTNVKGTANVLQGCIVNNVPRLVYTSSPSVVYDMRVLNIENGDESLPYPQKFVAPYPESKARAEKMVLQANGWEMVVEGGASSESRIERLSTCALRPHLIWGVGDRQLVPRLVALAKDGRLRIVGDGRNKISLTHVDNAVAGHIQAMAALAPDSPVAGQAYFINDPEPVCMWPWINQIVRGFGAPEATRRIPYRLGWLLGGFLEMAHALFPALGEPRLTRFVAAQMAGSHWFNCAKAQRDFGYRPEIDPDTGMKQLLTASRTG